MGILFSAPQAEFEYIQNDWFEEVKEIAKRGVFVGGIKVTHFESIFAEYIGAKHAVSVANGTDALFLALKALNIGPGDEVITATNTFIATVEAIYHTGAKPVLVDCDPDTYLIDLQEAVSKKNFRTKAIIPVHLYGQMVQMEEVMSWAKKEGIFVVEDCAQAAGAKIDNRMAGSFGDAGCFSFYPEKNLGALGDGGMITTSSDEVAKQLKLLRNHGGDGRYNHFIPGFNSRLDPIQASALQLKLKYLGEWTHKRIEIAKWYEKKLADVEEVTLPIFQDDGSHVFHLYVVRVDSAKRDKLKKHLLKKGVLTAIQYPLPVHMTEAFQALGHQAGDLPVSEKYSQEIISLPMNITITESDVELIANEIKACLIEG